LASDTSTATRSLLMPLPELQIVDPSKEAQANHEKSIIAWATPSPGARESPQWPTRWAWTPDPSTRKHIAKKGPEEKDPTGDARIVWGTPSPAGRATPLRPMRWDMLAGVRARARERQACRRDQAVLRLQAAARGRAVRRSLCVCSVCLDNCISASPVCNGADGHRVCARCLAMLGMEAAARPVAHLTDHELATGRYAIRCPCSAMDCSAFMPTYALDCALQVAVARHDGELAECLYGALVALACAQQPLSALGAPSMMTDPSTMARASSFDSRTKTMGVVLAAMLPASATKWAAARAEANTARRERVKAAAREAAAQAEGIRAQFRLPDGSYAAFQCGRCGFGPVEHTRCGDLQAHHGERRGGGRGHVSNSCPSCGWFSSRISDWPQWDGTHVGVLTDGEAERARRTRLEAARTTITAAVGRMHKRRKKRRAPTAHAPQLRDGQWQCLQCTLVNPRRATACQVCDLRRPNDY